MQYWVSRDCYRCFQKHELLPADQPVQCMGSEAKASEFVIQCCREKDFCNLYLRPTLVPPTPKPTGRCCEGLILLHPPHACFTILVPTSQFLCLLHPTHVHFTLPMPTSPSPCLLHHPVPASSSWLLHHAEPNYFTILVPTLSSMCQLHLFHVYFYFTLSSAYFGLLHVNWCILQKEVCR